MNIVNNPRVARLIRWIKTRPISSLLIAVLTVYLIVEHRDLWEDFNGVSMSEYRWPLEMDARRLVRQYKNNTLKLSPISPDNYSISLHPPPESCKQTTLLTVLIKVRVQDKYNRNLLRRTWIEDLKANHLRHAFLIGECYSERCKSDLQEELIEHKDIVQGNFVDAYFNNTVKFRMALKYVLHYCNTTKYLLIIDADYSLNVKRLMRYLGELGYPKDLYAGQLWDYVRPMRRTDLPQHMTYEFYPFRRLPPFIAAGASIMSVEILEPLHIVSLYTKFVKFDDVFYGMVAYKLNITLVDASHLLPSTWIPRLGAHQKHRDMIGSHRFGKLEEVDKIHDIIHGQNC